MVEICTVVTSQDYMTSLESNYNNSSLKINVFTNKKFLQSEFYNLSIIFIESDYDDFDFSRFIKFYFIETFFESTVLYIDTTVIITEEFISSLDINDYSAPIFFRHYKRKSGIEEAIYCLLVKKITFYNFLLFVYHFARNSFRSQLCLGGVFLVGGALGFSTLIDWRHKYEEIGIKRDQLSLSLLNLRNSVDLNGNIVIVPNRLVLSPFAKLLVKLKNFLKVE